MNQAYLETVRLLLSVAPVIFQKPGFALKGGTAINLFLRDTPRLSVDLDLVYPDHQPSRDEALRAIRQHPRDLFDILQLYEHGGLTEGIVECFVCYLAGHNRPVHEVLFANKINISPAFANEFEGMTKEPVSLDELLQIRNELFADLPASLSTDHRQFLTGLVEGKPDWSLLACEHLAAMPAIRWKLTNLERLHRSNPDKFALQADELKKRFG